MKGEAGLDGSSESSSHTTIYSGPKGEMGDRGIKGQKGERGPEGDTGEAVSWSYQHG